MKCNCCGHDDGEELIEVDERVLNAAKSMTLVYKHSNGGGNLHVIIDDGNVDCSCDPDDWYDFEQDGKPTGKAQKAAEIKCLRLLSVLDYNERLAACKVWHEYLSEKEPAPTEVDIA